MNLSASACSYESKMRAFICFILTALAYTAQGASSPHIIGGKDALIGKFPYQVSLKVNGEHKCSGSIINELNVLTAAQCVKEYENSPNKLKVHAGTNFLNVPGDVHGVASISVHKDYDNFFYVNDIALVHLKRPITYNALVKPTYLTASDNDLEGKPCILSGWGTTKVNERTPSNNLQEIELKVYPQYQCGQSQWKLTKSHICTVTKAGKGACYGDAGGPLVANGAQIGIASFGTSCAIGDPDIYTRVTSFLPWITEHLKNEIIL